MGRTLLPKSSILKVPLLQNLLPEEQISSKLFNSLGHLCVLLESKQNFPSRIAVLLVAMVVLKVSRISLLASV